MSVTHEFPCKQHVDFRAARYQRKHINLLLLDNCEEYARTYGPDKKPQAHASIETALKQAATSRHLQPKSSACTAALSLTKRTKNLWQSASAEGGQEPADLTKQVGNKRTPTGTFFGLANPGLARPPQATDSVPNMRRDNLTQSALGIGRALEAHNTAETTASGTAVKGVIRTTEPDRNPKSWLMPHQLTHRLEGIKAAKAVNSKRSPSGGFANFDLAKAPK